MLSVALEQQMLSWLCNCAKEWANGSFSSASCTLDLLLNWAWERTLALKNNADNLCMKFLNLLRSTITFLIFRLGVSLFDYSGLKLDANSQKIVNCCCRQLANLCVFYTYIFDKLEAFVYDSGKFLFVPKFKTLRLLIMDQSMFGTAL